MYTDKFWKTEGIVELNVMKDNYIYHFYCENKKAYIPKSRCTESKEECRKKILKLKEKDLARLKINLEKIKNEIERLNNYAD